MCKSFGLEESYGGHTVICFQFILVRSLKEFFSGLFFRVGWGIYYWREVCDLDWTGLAIEYSSKWQTVTTCKFSGFLGLVFTGTYFRRMFALNMSSGGLFFGLAYFQGAGWGAISRNIRYLMCGVLSSGLWVRLQRCERTLKNRWLVWNGIQMSRQGKILFYFNYKIVKVTLKSTKNKTVTNCDCVKNEIFARFLFWVLAILGFAR